MSYGGGECAQSAVRGVVYPGRENTSIERNFRSIKAMIVNSQHSQHLEE